MTSQYSSVAHLRMSWVQLSYSSSDELSWVELLIFGWAKFYPLGSESSAPVVPVQFSSVPSSMWRPSCTRRVPVNSKWAQSYPWGTGHLKVSIPFFSVFFKKFGLEVSVPILVVLQFDNESVHFSCSSSDGLSSTRWVGSQMSLCCHSVLPVRQWVSFSAFIEANQLYPSGWYR